MFEVIEDGNVGKPRVLVLSEHLNATFFISFDIPLRRLHSRGEINFAALSQQAIGTAAPGCWISFTNAFRPDVVVFTRYAQPFGPEMLIHFNALGIPVVYHIDDNLLELPESLGSEILKRQGADATVQARKHLLGNVGLIYASTAELARVLSSQFPTQRIVAGEIYAPYMGDELSTPLPPRRPVIGYMGSKGHRHDLDLAVPAICELLDENPDLCFETFGTIQVPERLATYQGRVRAHSVNKSYYGFLETLKELGWSVGLAPLVDEPFNRCKAPTKFIEYTAAGIPVVASNVVYERIVPEGGGIIVSNNEWKFGIKRALDPTQAHPLLKSAIRYCSSEFNAQRLAQQVMSVLSIAMRAS